MRPRATLVGHVALAGAMLLLAAQVEAAAQTTALQAEGLRLAQHECFASATARTRLDCRAEDFEFPQAGQIEGRMVRLLTRGNETRYLRRSDVRSVAASGDPTALPTLEEAPGAVIRAEVATPVSTSCEATEITALEPFATFEFDETKQSRTLKGEDEGKPVDWYEANRICP